MYIFINLKYKLEVVEQECRLTFILSGQKDKEEVIFLSIRLKIQEPIQTQIINII